MGGVDILFAVISGRSQPNIELLRSMVVHLCALPRGGDYLPWLKMSDVEDYVRGRPHEAVGQLLDLLKRRSSRAARIPHVQAQG